MDDLNAELRQTPIDDVETRNRILDDLSSTERQLNTAKQDLKVQEIVEDGVNRMDQDEADLRAQKSRENGTEEGVERLKGEVEGKDQELTSAKQETEQINDQIAQKNSELETERQNSEVERSAQGALDDANTHIKGHQDADAARQQVDDLSKQQTDLQDNAAGLRQQANEVERVQTLHSEADTHQQNAQDASAAAQRSLDTVRSQTDGQRVTVIVDGVESTRPVRDVDANGITVPHGTNGTVHVPWAQVGDPSIRSQGQEAQTQSQRADTEHGHFVEKSTMAHEAGAPSDSNPEALRQQAQQLDDQANGMSGDIRSAEERSVYDSGATLVDHQTAAAEAQRRLQAAAGAGNRVTELETELRSLQQNKDDNAARIKLVQKELNDLRTDLADARSMVEQTDYAENSSSGNAPGGTGSAYQTFETQFFTLITTVTGTRQLVQAFVPNAQTFGDVTQAGVEGLFGIQPETAAQIKDMATRQAMAEELLTFTPPAEMESMQAHREAARLAYADYAAAHEEAARAHAAGEVVGAMARETEEMARGGEPIVAAAQSSQSNVREGQGEEDRRSAALANANTASPEQDSGFASMVGELIMALADNSDASEGTPGAGGASGDDMANAQGEASERAEGETDAARGFSDEQRGMLDSALSVGQQQEQQTSSDIQMMDSKAQEEAAVHPEIINQKVGALTRREEAKGRVVAESEGFVSDYSALSDWASEYKKRRERITSKD
jgi:hypothetical protein